MVFSKVKQWLGIEGIKMEIELPEVLSKSVGSISGSLLFSTMQTQQILSVNVRVYETYSHGRRKNKRTQEFEIGELELPQSFMVYPEDEKAIVFTIHFKLVKSEMDKLQEKGGFMGGLASIAKKTKGVKSTYRIEAVARVGGTKLNPFAKKEIIFQ